jgi:AraC-like DNA-binding protein
MAPSFHSYLPENSLLKKYIHYFYTDSSSDNSHYKKYSFFPHIFTTLSFYYNARVPVCSETPFKIVHENNRRIIKVLTNHHSTKTVEQKGEIDKIAIVFKPLGLNHFLREPFCTIAKEEIQLFEPVGNSAWNTCLEGCFSLPGPAERIRRLENFLLSLYLPKQLDVLYRIMDDLTNFDQLLPISEIAKKHYVSYRTLNRHFLREFAHTPETFRTIARFRHAVNQKIILQSKSSLTGIACESGYLDQSYMIKTFKKLTGLTPTAFFNQGLHLGIADTFWKIHALKNGE